MAHQEVDILIIGAGVVGLTLGHALEKAGITYQILERDESIDSRGNGWAITLHWARDALQQCIPDNLFNSLGLISVDKDMSNKDAGNYKFFNMETLERKCTAPVDPTRMRIRREGFRKLLLGDLNILWDAKVKAITMDQDGINATVSNGLTYRGNLLVGADGSNSVVRKFLCPETAENMAIPVRFIGVVVKLTPKIADNILSTIDPLTFQGCHPETGVYLFFSLVSTPEINKSIDSPEPYYQVQICVSWKPKESEDKIPSTTAGRVQKMKEVCSNMALPIQEMVNSISEDSEAIEVRLQDWPCLDWQNYGGHITLAGDSAHAMTMYRGEAANYGITDAADLAEAIISYTKGNATQSDAIAAYEQKLRLRSQKGVLLSRQACLDAHDYEKMTELSPLLHNR